MSLPGETDWGKGSFPRTWNNETFRSNFAEINWGKKPVPVVTDALFPITTTEVRGDYSIGRNQRGNRAQLIYIPGHTHTYISGPPEVIEGAIDEAIKAHKARIDESLTDTKP